MCLYKTETFCVIFIITHFIKIVKKYWQIIEISAKILDFVNKKVYNEYTNIDKVLYLN